MLLGKCLFKFLCKDMVKPMPLSSWLGRNNICFFVTVSFSFAGSYIVLIVGDDKLLSLINLTCVKTCVITHFG